MPRPRVLLLDVNETLSDLAPMAELFADLGAPAALAQGWLAAVLRDGISLACSDTSAAFAEIARDVSRRMLAPHLGERFAGGPDEAADRVISAFTSLGVHDDVVPGLTALAASGVRLVTLSNGAASVADALLERAGVRAAVERCLSVSDAGVWKPAAPAYTWACAEVGVDPADAMLVAVHPWDTDGAHRAGLGSAWVDRSGLGLGFPAHFSAPTLQVGSLVELAEAVQGAG